MGAAIGIVVVAISGTEIESVQDNAHHPGVDLQQQFRSAP
jgi:hypothetical protein